jgi:hypothetical protein
MAAGRAETSATECMPDSISRFDLLTLDLGIGNHVELCPGERCVALEAAPPN